MANRDNHYEAAFEEFLRERRMAYVAVDEARRSLVAGGSLKSLDFIVSPEGGTSWLVDVKGRRFPSGDTTQQYWRNWSTRDDLWSLAQWHRHFGQNFEPLLVFAYHLVAGRSPVPEAELFEFRGQRYGFVAIRLADYVPHARPLSTSWDTVSMSTPIFRRYARPVSQWFSPPPAVAVSGDAPWQLTAVEVEWQ